MPRYAIPIYEKETPVVALNRAVVAVAYGRAVALADNDAERAFLTDRLAEVTRAEARPGRPQPAPSTTRDS
ncbi:hypothetical protein [Streptomyces sp. NPDC058665]|uniref:hypothetical protein n=1 Tax=Streptomyces sp. NPDC058665 TaxID=3346586 RepID=UPI00366A1244